MKMRIGKIPLHAKAMNPKTSRQQWRAQMVPCVDGSLCAWLPALHDSTRGWLPPQGIRAIPRTTETSRPQDAPAIASCNRLRVGIMLRYAAAPFVHKHRDMMPTRKRLQDAIAGASCGRDVSDVRGIARMP